MVVAKIQRISFVPKEVDLITSSKSNILVIDDDLVFRHLLKAALSSSGYYVDLVENCNNGFQRLKTKSYGVITLDVNMPEMDGLRFYSRIREEWPGLDKKVLFVTGDLSNETQSFFIQNGCRHLSKPFTMPDLLHKVDAIMRKEEEGPCKMFNNLDSVKLRN